MSNARNLARLLPDSSGLLPDANLNAISSTKIVGTGSVRGMKTRAANVSASGASLSYTINGQFIIAGYSMSYVPVSANSNFIISYQLNPNSAGGARLNSGVWVRNSTASFFTRNLDSETYVQAGSLDMTATSTSGWTSTGDKQVYGSQFAPYIGTAYFTNANMPSYSVGNTIQIAIGIGTDTGGYTATANFGGNTNTFQPFIQIIEVAP